MKDEIHVALQFLSSYIHRYGSLEDKALEQFRSRLEQVLLGRYQGHWYTDKPIKGQAYRSLDFNKENNYCDAIVSQVCQDLTLPTSSLGIRYEFTLWIDPFEVSVRLGNHVSPKDHEQFIVAQFDRDGNKRFHHELNTLLSQSRLPLANIPRVSPSPSPPLVDSLISSGRSTPQRTSSESLILQPSSYGNGPLFTPPRALSPQAPVFEMSSPINVPMKSHPLENSIDSTEESSSVEDNRSQPERSDTPHSMHSTTSNESSDSGYCGYVESYPYYYKLNRLNKALALQKFNMHKQPMAKTQHSRRNSRAAAATVHYQQEPMFRSTSPPTPTPLNIDRLAPFYNQAAYFSMALESGKASY